LAQTISPAAQPHAGLGERVLAWVQAHRQATTYGAAAVLIAGAVLWWNAVSARQSEDRAWELLSQARVAFESGNLPLAASEFSRIGENYGGTNAAQQAYLLLAQVRLRQGQPQQAIEVLLRLSGNASAAFRAQSWSLLGAAYENSGAAREAAGAYERAAEHAEYASIKAQALSDAGRAWVAAGDTARAIAVYQRILRDEGTVGVQEAAIRLSELTRGAVELPRRPDR
jgi:tetratricopeptide (TPR) repeat protein